MLLHRLGGDADGLDQAIDHVRDYLSDELRCLTNRELCDQLRPLGEKLQKKHQRLPRISALGAYSQESG